MDEAAMKVWLVGKDGQLGRAVCAAAPLRWRLRATGPEEVDIRDRDAVMTYAERSDPELIINAAAYTAVDRAEDEPELAEAVNARGAQHVAEAAAATGAGLVQISTDFVFDGTTSRPYPPEALPNPLGVYGASKWRGEQVVQAQAGLRAVIVRTAWVYAAGGHNFVSTMLRLMREKPEIRVVADQIGTPTWASNLARAVISLGQSLASQAGPGADTSEAGVESAVEEPRQAAREGFDNWSPRGQSPNADLGRVKADARQDTPVYHFTDAGVASWYDFAVAIQEEALAKGLLERAVPIHPIGTEAFPTRAQRPAYSVLDKGSCWARLGWSPPHWRVALREALAEF